MIFISRKRQFAEKFITKGTEFEIRIHKDSPISQKVVKSIRNKLWKPQVFVMDCYDGGFVVICSLMAVHI